MQGGKYRERDFDSRLTGIMQTSIRIQQPANAAVAKKMLSGPKSKKARKQNLTIIVPRKLPRDGDGVRIQIDISVNDVESFC